MGKTKKVILFIVEGITDKTALGSVLDAILSNEKIHFAITEGDYAETWAFIESGLHSLERWSNFHLYFDG